MLRKSTLTFDPTGRIDRLIDYLEVRGLLVDHEIIADLFVELLVVIVEEDIRSGLYGYEDRRTMELVVNVYLPKLTVEERSYVIKTAVVYYSRLAASVNLVDTIDYQLTDSRGQLTYLAYENDSTQHPSISSGDNTVSG